MTALAQNQVNADQVDHYFEPVAPLPTKLRLRCLLPCEMHGALTALIQGISIGQVSLARAIKPGEIVEIPVGYFPQVEFPNKIRFAFEQTEISPFFPVNSREEANLIGGGVSLVAQDLSLDRGLLRGTLAGKGAFEAKNAYARINGFAIRAVDVEPLRNKDDGGFSAQFAVVIHPNDYNDSGLTVEIHVAGIDAPVGALSYVRGSASEQEMKIVALDESIRQLQKSFSGQVEMLSENFERRIELQQQRIDAFIEYAVAILVDHAAGNSSLTDPAAFAAALQSIKLSQPAPEAAWTARQVTTADVEIASSNFTFGWYAVESGDHGNFRWMASTGHVRNPYPGQVVNKVELEVVAVYGAAVPTLNAVVGDVELRASVERSGTSFLITLEPRAEERVPAIGDSIRIGSYATGCPATDEGTTDERTLSIAVKSIRFDYGTPAEVDAHA